MPTTKSTPSEVANEFEMLAQQSIDEGDREAAELYMRPVHAIRHLHKTLTRLNQRVHSGYDFSADPDRITAEVGDILR